MSSLHFDKTLMTNLEASLPREIIRNHLNCYNTNNSQLPHHNVINIFFDSTQRCWISTSSGICFYNSKSNEIEKAGAFPNYFCDAERIRAFYEDNDNNIIIVPAYGNIKRTDLNLSFLDNDYITLQNNNTSFINIFQDQNNFYWCICNDGAFIFDYGTKKIVNLNFKDGLTSTRFVGNGIKMSSDSTLWLFANTGLFSYTSNKYDQKD